MLLVDDSEFLTVVVGKNIDDSRFLQEAFGFASSVEMQNHYSFPALQLQEESQTAEYLNAFIEQIRYERADGAPMSVRVILGDPRFYKEILSEIWVEDTEDR